LTISETHLTVYEKNVTPPKSAMAPWPRSAYRRVPAIPVHSDLTGNESNG
jgi:hypothetical protein